MQFKELRESKDVPQASEEVEVEMKNMQNDLAPAISGKQEIQNFLDY